MRKKRLSTHDKGAGMDSWVPVRQVDIARMDAHQGRHNTPITGQKSVPLENIRLRETLEKLQAELKLSKLMVGKLSAENNALKSVNATLRHNLGRCEREAKNRNQEGVELHELQRQEIDSLKRENAGLREVLLEMEHQQLDVSNEELVNLHKALEQAEAKHRKAEQQAQQARLLRRERAVQEIAIEMLSEDLDALSDEKQKLMQECDRLNRELCESQGQYFEDTAYQAE